VPSRNPHPLDVQFPVFLIDLTGEVLGLAERVEEGYQTRFLQRLDDFAFWWFVVKVPCAPRRYAVGDPKRKQRKCLVYLVKGSPMTLTLHRRGRSRY